MQILPNKITKNYLDSLKPSSSIDKSQFDRFDLAEGIFETPKVIVQKLKEINGSTLAKLPDHNCDLLKKKIGRFLSIPAEYISIFNGSDSALEYVSRMFINKEDIVINLTPEYSRLASANLKNANNLELIKLDLNKQYENSIQRILPKLKSNMVMLISNPNNPTGRFLEKEIFAEIAKRVRLLIVDEAYQEYYSIKKQYSTVDLIPRFKNIIVLRTFSKYFCLAGERIGYIVADSDIINMVNKFKLRYEVSTISQELAVAALDEINSFTKYKDIVDTERNKLVKVIQSNSLLYVVNGSVTNFVMIKHLKKDLFESLKANSILTNLIIQNSKEVYVRICLNLPKTNIKLFNILSTI